MDTIVRSGDLLYGILPQDSLARLGIDPGNRLIAIHQITERSHIGARNKLHNRKRSVRSISRNNRLNALKRWLRRNRIRMAD